MAAFLILSPKGADAFDPDCRFIRDGFSWSAAIFPTLWAILHGTYMDAAVLFVLRLAGVAMLSRAGISGAGLAVLLGSSLIYGLEARHRLANVLQGRGWLLRDRLAARDMGEAEEIYYVDMPVAMPEPRSPIPKLDPEASGGQMKSGRQDLAFGMISVERGRR